MRPVAALIAGLALFSANSAMSAEITPHEAVFEVKLEGLQDSGQVQSWEGSMRYSISRDCQKWRVETYSLYRLTVNGEVIEVSENSKSYEGLDGKRMEFDVRLEINGRSVHRKGSATLRGAGQGGEVIYRLPQSEKAELPAGVMFPMAAWRASLSNLAKGKKAWRQLLFQDGEVADVSYSVRKRGVAAPGRPAGDARLVSRAGWLIDSTAHSRQANGDMHLSTVSHANGVSSMIRYDFGPFSTKNTLVEVRALPAPQC